MREIHTHKVNGCNESLQVFAADEPGHGGACHEYLILGPHQEGKARQNGEMMTFAEIDFQNGPIAEAGVNGVTHETLLAILMDRLEGFQSGPYACEENRNALMFLKEAQSWLQMRTRRRVARGVEGTHQV